MHSLLQNHVQRHVRTFQTDVDATLQPAPSSLSVLHPKPSDDIQALLLVHTNRTLAVANHAATKLLNLPTRTDRMRGQLMDDIADGMLASVPLRPTALRASSEFLTADGRILLATSRLLQSDHQQFKGWMVALQDTSGQQHSGLNMAPCPGIESIQQQVNALQELIALLPQFSQHHYWQHLLVEHMQKLTEEMAITLQHLNMRSY